MRTIGLIALVTTSFALGACGGEEPAPQAPPPPPAPPPVASATAPASAAPATPPAPAKPTLAELVPETLKGIADAFNAHDSKKLVSYYADDATVADYGAGPGARGRDEMGKSIQGLFDAFPDAKVAPMRTWIKGNVAVTEIGWTGTHTGDFMGFKANKKPVGQVRLHIAWFNDNGLVKEEHQYADGAGFIAQVQGKKTAPPVLTLPTNPPEVHIAKGTPDEDKLADWAKAMDETMSKDDPKAVLATTADDADYWLSFTGAPATKGKKDLTKDLTGMFKAFPDQKWTPNNAWGIDGFAIIEHTMTGTQKGAMGPLAPSHKPVTWHVADIYQPTADGKLQHGWGYGNMIEVMVQTGAFKPPSEKPAAKDKEPAAKASPAGAPKPAEASAAPAKPTDKK